MYFYGCDDFLLQTLSRFCLIVMTTYTFLDFPTLGQLEQIISLYRLEGWWDDSPDNPDLVARIVAGSHCFMVVIDGDEVIGMGRAISDRASDAYIQDVTVKTAYRGRGIGTQIIARLIDRLHRDGLYWIGLIAERNSHPFYERLGFNKMPNSVAMLKRD